jgi:hypothetical protein
MLFLAVVSAGTLMGSDPPTPAYKPPEPRMLSLVTAINHIVGRPSAGSYFESEFVDLGDDSREEALVFMVDPAWCGSGGCTLFVMTPTDGGWKEIGRTTVSREPIYRLPTKHDGWNDLGITISGGGSEEALASVAFADGRYQSNPTFGTRLEKLPAGALEILPKLGGGGDANAGQAPH